MSNTTSLQRKKTLIILAGLGIFIASISSFDYVRSTTSPTEVEVDRITVEKVRVAVALSQAQLLQSQTNLIKFQSKYDTAKNLFQKGTANRQQLDTAKAGYELAQVQKCAALLGVRESSAQLVNLVGAIHELPLDLCPS
jgi:multidrug resistance efflux pump